MLIGDRSLYQCFAYSEPPVIRRFAPNFLQLEAAPLPEIRLVARFWAMESRAAGCQFALTNTSAADLDVAFDLFGQVVIDGRNRKLNVLTMADNSLALHLGQIGDINPVVTLEGASVEAYGGRINSPKLGRRFTLRAGATLNIPFVVAGLADMRDSYSVAMNWMSRPWDPYFERINRDAAAVPRIATGNAGWDRVIDLSYVHLLQSLMDPTEHLPHTSFVANRATKRGWSRRDDGSDHIRPWSGQDPTIAYLSVAALASIDGDLASSIIRNFIAIQDETGFIDRQPGLGGQRQGLLMMPLLARMSWLVYQRAADNDDFLSGALPALLAFYRRWFAADHDIDGDGVPEWRSERQLGYVAFPTFGRGQFWAQGANINQMESPDLLAYLISEADAIYKIATALGEEDSARDMAASRERLLDRLDEFWDGRRFSYRDRDTHLTDDGIELLRGGAGDQDHKIERDLLFPARVMVRVVGGVSQRPRITMQLDGADASGDPCRLEVDVDEFDWLNRQGVFISNQVFSRIDRLAISGLSRVYKVYAKTIDSSRLDINALLPLWAGGLDRERSSALVDLALNEDHFMRPNGLTMVSASDRNFDPSNARGGGGVWMYWLSLVGEGLVNSGHHSEAADLVKRVLTGLSRVLEREGYLSQFYHSDEAKGFGEDHHVGGIAPLHLLNEVIGIHILSPQKVRVAGEYAWGQAVTVEQHGVFVERNSDGTTIKFPSGHRATLPAAAPAQTVTDPAPATIELMTEPLPPAPESDFEAKAQDERRVEIAVQDCSDASEPETGDPSASADREPKDSADAD